MTSFVKKIFKKKDKDKGKPKEPVIIQILREWIDIAKVSKPEQFGDDIFRLIMAYSRHIASTADRLKRWIDAEKLYIDDAPLNETKSRRRRSKKIKQTIEKEKRERERVLKRKVEIKTVKVLIIGPHGAGKSTILKQMKQIAGESLEDEYSDGGRYIQDQCVRMMANLCTNSVQLNQMHPETKCTPELESIRDEWDGFISMKMSKVRAHDIKILWQDVCQFVYSEMILDIHLIFMIYSKESGTQ